MTPIGNKASPLTVLVVGPPSAVIGGMSSAVEQMRTLDFHGRYRLEFFYTTSAADPAESLISRTRRHVAHLQSLSNAIRHLRPAVVHIHTCSGFSFYRSVADLLIAKRRSCRNVLHIHGAAFDRFYAASGTLRQRCITWSLSLADCIVALSPRWRNELLMMAPRANVAVVENAVQPQTDPPQRSHGGPCRFLLLARMDKWKGVDDLLEAAEHMRSAGCAFELVLAGPSGTASAGGTLVEKLRCKGLHGTVRYVGPVRGDDKHDLLRRADVYVQPSHHEGMPIAILEALSYGLPVVATQVGAVPEMMTHGCEGLLVPPRAPGQLAEAMIALAENPTQRHAMGNAASLLVASRFSTDRLTNDLVAIYNDLLRPPGAQTTTRRTNAPRDSCEPTGSGTTVSTA